MADDLRALVFEVKNWGWVGLVASERGLRLLTLPSSSEGTAWAAVRELYPDAPSLPDDVFLLEVARQIKAYLSGDLREFSTPLDLRGHTSFALSVWATNVRIPYGQTRTYRWIADLVGSGPSIYQAVGAALGANPIPLIIPCHRVIASDGSLHGYGGGLLMKARLLALESGQASFGLD